MEASQQTHRLVLPQRRSGATALGKLKKSRQREKQYIRNAQRKGRSHNACLERLFLKACVYCGEHAVVNGVDRLNNDEGYEVGNIVAACKTYDFIIMFPLS